MNTNMTQRALLVCSSRQLPAYKQQLFTLTTLPENQLQPDAANSLTQRKKTKTQRTRSRSAMVASNKTTLRCPPHNATQHNAAPWVSGLVCSTRAHVSLCAAGIACNVLQRRRRWVYLCVLNRCTPVPESQRAGEREVCLHPCLRPCKIFSQLTHRVLLHQRVEQSRIQSMQIFGASVRFV